MEREWSEELGLGKRNETEHVTQSLITEYHKTAYAIIKHDRNKNFFAARIV